MNILLFRLKIEGGEQGEEDCQKAAAELRWGRRRRGGAAGVYDVIATGGGVCC